MNPLEEIICCPCDAKSKLSMEDGTLVCEDKKCRHAFGATSINKDTDIPILINADRCDTVLDAKNVSTTIHRKTKSAKTVKNAFFSNKTTKANIEIFIEQIKVSKDTDKARVLVIGGGERGNNTSKIYTEAEIETISFDIYASEDTNLVADAHYMPFVSQVFDGVLIQAVLEHVVDPTAVVNEIHRILKPTGIVYSETPFLQPVHEGAYDFTRYTVLGHRYLFKNFAEIKYGPLNGIEASLPWSLKQLTISVFGYWRILSVFTAGLFLLFKPLRYIESKQNQFDSCAASYFLGRKSDITLSHKELIRRYKK